MVFIIGRKKKKRSLEKDRNAPFALSDKSVSGLIDSSWQAERKSCVKVCFPLEQSLTPVKIILPYRQENRRQSKQTLLADSLLLGVVLKSEDGTSI